MNRPVGSLAPQHVYFIQAADGGAIKIGIATDVHQRLMDLQVGSAVELKVIGTALGGRELEKELHNRLAHHRIRGEWFRPTAPVLAMIKELGATADQQLTMYRPSTDRLRGCSNCGFQFARLDGDGHCAACREFAELRRSHQDPFIDAA